MLEKINPKALKICCILEGQGYSAYIVGGAVRDLLMGKEPKDWDIATSAKPEEVRSIFYKTVDIGIKHGTVTVLLDDESFEVTTYRIDGNYSDSRHPDSVEFTDDIVKDLSRRDFTINAMAMDSNGNIIDPFMGRFDIMNKTIRCVGDANLRFAEDPLRILRACRFKAQLPGFIINNLPTRFFMAVYAEALLNISSERIRDELTKILVSEDPISGFEAAYWNNVTNYILPEFNKMMACKHQNPFFGRI